MTAALAFLVPHAVSPRRRPAANPSSQTTALRSLLPLRCVFRQRSALRPGARASRERRWRRYDRSTASSARRSFLRNLSKSSLLRIRKLSARKANKTRGHCSNLTSPPLQRSDSLAVALNETPLPIITIKGPMGQIRRISTDTISAIQKSRGRNARWISIVSSTRKTSPSTFATLNTRSAHLLQRTSWNNAQTQRSVKSCPRGKTSQRPCPTAQRHGTLITRSAKAPMAFFASTRRCSSACSTNSRTEKASFIWFGAYGVQNTRKAPLEAMKTPGLRGSRSSSQHLQDALTTYGLSKRAAVTLLTGTLWQRPKSISSKDATGHATMKSSSIKISSH